MKSEGSKHLKYDSAPSWAGISGGNTPTFNKKAALPKSMNKPFLKRLVEWLTS